MGEVAGPWQDPPSPPRGRVTEPDPSVGPGQIAGPWSGGTPDSVANATLADVGHAAASGAAMGATDVVGLPGSMAQVPGMLAEGAVGIPERLGLASPEMTQAARERMKAVPNLPALAHDKALELVARYGAKPLQWAGVTTPEKTEAAIESAKSALGSAESRGDVSRIMGIPGVTGQGAERALRSVVPWLDYDARTEPGKFTQSAARMAVNSLAGGPGRTVAGKAGLGALAGLGAEGAGHVAEAVAGPAAAPYGRMAGAMITPSLAMAGRDFMFPKTGAREVVADALGADAARTGQVGGARMTPEQIKESAARGAEPMVADMAGTNTRQLIKRVGGLGNQAPAELEAMNQRIAGRAEGAGTRLADQIAADYKIAVDSGERLAQVKALNKPVVDAAYDAWRNDPRAAAVWSPQLQAIAQSKTLQSAMKKAADDATDPGSPIRAFRPATATTPMQRPNLDYWDQVKRNLDDMKTSAENRQELAEARRLGTLKQNLMSELTTAVPSYKGAVGTAKYAFGEEDAIKAGYDLMQRGSPFDTRKILDEVGKLQPGQRDLLAQGAADYLRTLAADSNKGPAAVIKTLRDPQSSTRVKAVLGDAAYDRIYGRALSERLTSGSKPFESMDRSSPHAGVPGSAIFGAATGAVLDVLPAMLIGAPIGGASTAWTAAASAAFAALRREGMNATERRLAPEIIKLARSTDAADMEKLAQMARSNRHVDSAVEKIARATQNAVTAHYRANPSTDTRPGRAAGGRTALNHVAHAERLIREVARTRNAQARGTEPLLRVPDETITRALAAANRSV